MSEIQIGHLEVDSPWGNASGVVKSLEDVKLMSRTGVGWIEGGSYTLLPRMGNALRGETVYHYDQQTGETTNTLGMPNKGILALEKELPLMMKLADDQHKPFLVNVAPVSNDPVSETQEIVARVFEAGAEGVILNAGCPNVVAQDGSRHEILSTNADALKLVLTGLSHVVAQHRKEIFIRTSPLDTYEDTLRIMQAIHQSGVVSAVFAPNAWPSSATNDNPSRNPELLAHIGGKSGPAMADPAHEQTAWAVKALAGTGIDVVSSLGIMNGKELHRRLAAGAVAGCGTTFFYESAEEGWSEATDRLLREYAEASIS